MPDCPISAPQYVDHPGIHPELNPSRGGGDQHQAIMQRPDELLSAEGVRRLVDSEFEDVDIVVQLLEVVRLDNSILVWVSDGSQKVAVSLHPKFHDLIHFDGLSIGQLIRVLSVDPDLDLPCPCISGVEPIQGARYSQIGFPDPLPNPELERFTQSGDHSQQAAEPRFQTPIEPPMEGQTGERRKWESPPSSDFMIDYIETSTVAESEFMAPSECSEPRIRAPVQHHPLPDTPPHVRETKGRWGSSWQAGPEGSASHPNAPPSLTSSHLAGEGEYGGGGIDVEDWMENASIASSAVEAVPRMQVPRPTTVPTTPPPGPTAYTSTLPDPTQLRPALDPGRLTTAEKVDPTKKLNKLSTLYTSNGTTVLPSALFKRKGPPEPHMPSRGPPQIGGSGNMRMLQLDAFLSDAEEEHRQRMLQLEKEKSRLHHFRTIVKHITNVKDEALPLDGRTTPKNVLCTLDQMLILHKTYILQCQKLNWSFAARPSEAEGSGGSKLEEFLSGTQASAREAAAATSSVRTQSKVATTLAPTKKRGLGGGSRGDKALSTVRVQRAAMGTPDTSSRVGSLKEAYQSLDTVCEDWLADYIDTQLPDHTSLTRAYEALRLTMPSLDPFKALIIIARCIKWARHIKDEARSKDLCGRLDHMGMAFKDRYRMGAL